MKRQTETSILSLYFLALKGRSKNSDHLQPELPEITEHPARKKNSDSGRKNAHKKRKKLWQILVSRKSQQLDFCGF